ncbi:unnamed protein product [Didymodactylos carnosus]|uniref:RING-type E3 ubiquitin transferase n=1 Tax=Didymodactylos carnosus TaxID=1234261 RepID=A0A814UWG5_9BILA|nr:unnamed protein product [Didymodactylos carnosus]CAF1178753.1 unnamed protein product [Didymodactylos carnosus]CAF3743852.1 unnamed protein product [Didymodactylos carnosus]CAF3942952.1 unnamed protein product [Didymodactylos carnosus]
MSSERSISPDPIVERPGKSRSSGGYRGENADAGISQVSSAGASQVVQSARPPKRYREMSGSRSGSRSMTRSRSPSLSRSGGSRSPHSVSPDHLKSNAGGNGPAGDGRSKHRQEHSSSSKKKKSKRRSGSTELDRYDCGICLENVPNSKRLFGVLDNCDHVFCYECIVGWKRSKYSNQESARSLPCRYYLRHGFCRFSDRCFYDHREAARQYRQQHGSGGGSSGGSSHHEYHRSHYYSQRSPSPSREYRRREHRERAY